MCTMAENHKYYNTNLCIYICVCVCVFKCSLLLYFTFNCTIVQGYIPQTNTFLFNVLLYNVLVINT